MNNQEFKSLSRFEQLERSTKNTLLSEWTSQMEDIVKEVISYDFDGNKDQDFDAVYEVVGERMWESIDGDQDVIYTANAKLICELLQVDIFGHDEQTGDKFTSWSHAAFCGIYELIANDVDTYQIIKDALK